MRKLLIILVVVLSSCQSSTSGLTKEEFNAKIEAVEKTNLADKKLADGWYETASTENDFKRIDKRTTSQYFINPRPIVLPVNFNRHEEFENYEGAKGLAVYFDETGIDAWAKATGDNIGSYLIFVLDNEIFTVQYVKSKITNGASTFWKSGLTDNQWNNIHSMMKK